MSMTYFLLPLLFPFSFLENFQGAMMGTFKFGGSTVVLVFKNGFPLAGDGARYACRPKQSDCEVATDVIPANGSLFVAAADTQRVIFDDDILMRSQRLVETLVKVRQSVARVNAHSLIAASGANAGLCAPNGLEC